MCNNDTEEKIAKVFFNNEFGLIEKIEIDDCTEEENKRYYEK